MVGSLIAAPFANICRAHVMIFPVWASPSLTADLADFCRGLAPATGTIIAEGVDKLMTVNGLISDSICEYYRKQLQRLACDWRETA